MSHEPSISTDLLDTVSGGPDLLAWFDGQLPSFHDAEVTEVVLDRQKSRCRIKVHAFQGTQELDQTGHFITIKHVVIEFHFEEVVELELSDFNHQNVIDGLRLTRQPNGNFLLKLEPCFGLWGKIEAVHLQISLEPGTPKGVYNP